MTAAANGKVHHFTRWLLDGQHDPSAVREALFPNKTSSELAHIIDSTMSPRQLRSLFGTIFGSPTTSNNTNWMRQKLKTALGLGGKKQRGAPAPPRERSVSTNAGTRAVGRPTTPVRQPASFYPVAAAHRYRASPDPSPHPMNDGASTPAARPPGTPVSRAPAAVDDGSDGSAVSAAAAAAFGRSPSSDGWEDSPAHGPPVGQRAFGSFEDGAAALLAAAAEVDSASAAEAEAAAAAAVEAAAAYHAVTPAAASGSEMGGGAAGMAGPASSAGASSACSLLANGPPPGWAMALAGSPLAHLLVGASQQVIFNLIAALAAAPGGEAQPQLRR